MDVHEVLLTKASESVTNSIPTVTKAPLTPSDRNTKASAEVHATPIATGSELFELPLYKKSTKEKAEGWGGKVISCQVITMMLTTC